jgi:hypothetical protein
MSYKTPNIPTITGLAGIDKRLADMSLLMPSSVATGLSWLTYAFGCSDRIVEMRENKEFIYPACYQDLNSKDPISMMPNDNWQSFCFWVNNNGTKYNPKIPTREFYNISCIFFMDLRQIAPTDHLKATKTKIMDDIIDWFRKHTYEWNGVAILQTYLDDDISEVYKGFTVKALDNKLIQIPKYASKITFEFSNVIDCPSNTYA